MFRTREQKDFLRACSFETYKDGEGSNYGAQDGGFGSSEQRKGPGASGGGFALNWMPRTHGEALEPATRRDGGRTHGREVQPVGRNREASPGMVDSYCLAKGLWISKAGQGHGIEDRPLHQG